MIWPTLMKCPMCASLNREHLGECEVEATATLRQRYEAACVAPAHFSETDQKDAEIVLASRKRQMQIALTLRRHQAVDHVA